MTCTPRIAHSAPEILVFLCVTRCESCGLGPLAPLQRDVLERSSPGQSFTLPARCAACRTEARFPFEIQSPDETDRTNATVFNAGSRPSCIIDLTGWLTLYEMIRQDARRESDRSVARRFNAQAGDCLGEGLKFYLDAENDLPESSAFHGQASRDLFRADPARFSRRRLIGLRNALPVVKTSDPAASVTAADKDIWWWTRRLQP